jgi:basic membrane protein A and related proteins
MRIRSSGLAMLAVGIVLVTACQAAPSGSGALKIGVQTDVGSADDKNFNEYTYIGAKEGAKAIGATEPPVFVPKDESEYETGLNQYVDQGYNIVVVNGFNAVAPVVKFAKANPDVTFIGVDHSPCINAAGDADPTFTDCSGQMPDNYVGLNYQEDQAGYLAGIVAANITESNLVGAIGGITTCAPCIKYIQGFAMGVKSVNPDITVKVAWVTESDIGKAFFDQAGGKSFGEQFLAQNPGLDVLFQVAGQTGNGALLAACDAGINGVGVDVDQFLSFPEAKDCIVTSAEKKLVRSVSETIQAVAAGTAKGGIDLWDAKRDGVGISPFHDNADKVPDGTQAKVDEAFAAMKAGTLTTCPEDCAKVPAPPIGD